MLELTDLKREWDEFAGIDPNWVIIQRHLDMEAFFDTGVKEVDAAIRPRLEGFGLKSRRRALDFGCGRGRITRPLQGIFKHCVGVDLSSRMIDLARQDNAGIRGLTFSALTDLQLPFPDDEFDFVVTIHVLQHQLSRDGVLSWTRELLRVLAPGGLLMLQLPSGLLRSSLQLRRRVYRLLRSRGVDGRLLFKLRLNPLRMLAVPEEVMCEALERDGGEILAVERQKPRPWSDENCTYWVRKGRRPRLGLT